MKPPTAGSCRLEASLLISYGWSSEHTHQKTKTVVTANDMAQHFLEKLFSTLKRNEWEPNTYKPSKQLLL